MYGMGGMGMYGGGLGGMGGMYGSSMGLSGMGGYGGGMYGSSMGLGGMGGYGGGMYGGTMGGGLGGNMYGGNAMGSGGLLGGTTSNSIMDPNNPNGGLGAGANGQQQQQGSLLPPGPGDATSPIHQNVAPLPPLNETDEEKARRLRSEHRKERQLIKQQREQRKQVRMQARMEIAGNVTNVLVQTLRSTMELFAVCFGTYYSMKAVRSFAAMQENSSRMSYQRGPNGQMIPVMAPAAVATPAATTAARGGEGWLSRWKSWIIFGVLFVVGEVLYARFSARRAAAADARRSRLAALNGDRDALAALYGPDGQLSDEDDSCDSLSASSIFDAPESVSNGGNRHRASGAIARAPGAAPERRIFVAVYDYDGDEANHFTAFKAGDEFIVEDYNEESWCQARALDARSNASGVLGFVPGNYLRPVNRFTKL